MKKRNYILGFFIFLAVFSACGDADDPDNGNGTPPPETKGYEFVDMKEIFGFKAQSRYAYCPSLLKEEGGNVHMFFCGNPNELIMVDNIYHVAISADGSQTPAKSVIQPGVAGTWDDHHICDPSIIAGDFSMEGVAYKYALFYLTNKYGVYYNEIGVAFSNSVDGNSWVKYPKQIVNKTWNTDGDQALANGGFSWGVGQPSAISFDRKGEVLLTYTIGDIYGTRIVWAKLNMSNMDNFSEATPTTMLGEGLMRIDYLSKDYTCNSDLAIDKQNNMMLMVRPVQPHPTDYPAYLNKTLEVNYISLDDFLNSTGKWKALLRITPDITKYPRNHNAGIERNSYGEVPNWEEPSIYYTVSKATPDVSPTANKHAEWTYHIWKGQVKKKTS